MAGWQLAVAILCRPMVKEPEEVALSGAPVSFISSATSLFRLSIRLLCAYYAQLQEYGLALPNPGSGAGSQVSKVLL